MTLVGSLQSEIGCAGDWDPGCAAAHLTYDAADDVWQGTFTLPAGDYEYKAALNDDWAENYGLNAAPGGANIPLSLAAPTSVKFYYSHATHWVTDNQGSIIAVAPGSFQSEMGCAGDWDPGCLRSWLQDPDGNGTFTFATGLPAGAYETKVAINESWDENYGVGGIRDGANIAFTVLADNATTTFSYASPTHVLTVTGPGSSHDNNVEWDGLRHDSRSDVYRSPGGAVPAGTPVTLRFRTFHDDVTAVTTRVYSLHRAGQQNLAMKRVASAVSCYDAAMAPNTCDYWQTEIPASWGADNIWYRFVVTDGTDTAYYADDTPALDGGVGAASDEVVDNSWALMLAVPTDDVPEWAADAVIYQIFPDRFRNGRANNDAGTGDVRYDDPALALPWNTLPEGYCRNYADAASNCPWRYDTTPPSDSPTKEQPRGRDYMGGDLKGVDQQLDYLATLGVNTLYFNPVFDSGSNHGYDTQDYYQIDPYFGTQQDWDNLVRHADELGIRIILDGVFNHVSSDSPLFDRYGHYPQVGACESEASPYRDWFTFTPDPEGPCAGPDGPNSMDYEGWFGFDSIPVLTKTDAEVQEYFLTSSDSVTRHWLEAGASGWRLDVSGDASFPDGYWESFRDVVDATDSDALTISETWQKDSTLLRMLRGDRLDTTMNYRLRDAVLGLLSPQAFDSKGFADSGRIITPTEFVNRIASIREDYPDAAYYSLMNLLDSHDTERLLWTLTPGTATTADKVLDAANLAAGKKRQRIAALLQFTMPGAPTVFYGDEVGMTGADDPDDRRTYPWAGKGTKVDTRDLGLLAHYTSLGAARADNPALTRGDLRVLLADDDAGTLAYGRATQAQAAVVAVNRSAQTRTLAIPVAGYLPDGIQLAAVAAANTPVSGSTTVSGGAVQLTLPPLSGVTLASGSVDLAPPAPPEDLTVTDESDGSVTLTWSASAGAAGYDVYVSPLTGGGFVKVSDSPVAGTEFTADGLTNGVTSYFVVRAVDANGNDSAASNEVSAIAHPSIGWANLQWPPTLSHAISAVNRTDNVYGQVWIVGFTDQAGAAPGLMAELGVGPSGSNPAADPAWTWVTASFNADAGNNDEYVASLLPESTGDFDYVYRYSVTSGRDWVYADLNGPFTGTPANPGALTVTSSGDISAPAVPAGLEVTGASPEGVELAWDEVSGDATLHGYEVGRADAAGGPYTVVGFSSSTNYTDTQVMEGVSYHYVVRSVDTSFNRSDWSAEVSAVTERRTVSLTVNVTVPAGTDATGRNVHIAGFLDRLDGGLPQWEPTATPLTRQDATHWSITLTGEEGVDLEYKYALASWDYVEKDASCGEVANRQLTLTYGQTGNQTVNDTVINWRNVAPCGN